MKVMSRLSVVVGVLLVVVGLGSAIWAGWISYRQWLALDALRSADVQTATLPMLIACLGLLLGGFFVGLGMGRARSVAPTPAQPADPTA